MNFVKKFWPLSFKVKTKDAVKTFVIILVIYVVIPFVISAIAGILGGIAAALGGIEAMSWLGVIFGILAGFCGFIGGLCGLYCTAGIVFAILRFIGVGAFKSTEE